MKTMTRTLIIAAFTLLFVACGGNETELVNENLPLPQQIDQLIEQNEYEAALGLLEDKDLNDPEIRTLKEKTHLNYALHSMNTFDQTEMRTRMNKALVQFTEVLKINPQNQVARDNIDQILSIYQTIPSRDPEPEVIDGLREVGIDYESY